MIYRFVVMEDLQTRNRHIEKEAPTVTPQLLGCDTFLHLCDQLLVALPESHLQEFVWSSSSTTPSFAIVSTWADDISRFLVFQVTSLTLPAAAWFPQSQSTAQV